ncbi:L,D-transpeptidase [Paenibacillus humicola]|uniref:L,D-transpeptidase n=1 Tax=Paenibacillus humicola TaxID=3110540 RepID=UPI00237BCE5B|nr:L,D-transpeptidase [Paenibacillus humicola]
MGQQDDMDYLKRYVEQHPDNRMAWYLLGKQYMLEEKEAKANYCFLQAGSIYEAYERKRHPLAGEPQEMIAAWNRSRRLKSLLRRSAAAALLLLGFAMAEPLANVHDGSLQEGTAVETDHAGGQSASVRVAFIRPTDNDAVGKALGALLQEGRKLPDTGLAAMLEQNGGWRLWTGRTRLLLAVQSGGGPHAAISMLDAMTCACQPADDTEAARTYKLWAAGQEERWTLASGMAQYRELFGRLPESLDDLVQPYPNNVLAGETAGMKAIFPELLRELRAKEGDSASAAGNRGGGGPKAGAEQPAVPAAEEEDASLPDETLSIVIDKARHTLAVVSGDVIVRSYPVGLGGDKTPDGSFYISEKVKNPNGRDDGEFGSRGMVLSGTRYAIHGTDEPASIGKDESHGCIRMKREDIEELYDLVPLGTKAEIGSGELPGTAAPAERRFKLQPMQDETNPAVVYRWLS